MPMKKGAKKAIRWDKATMRLILDTRDRLEELGMRRPSIRAVLYLLLTLPGWKKDHYDTLTVRLGRWRDQGLIPWGLFADDGAGSHYVPLTAREIAERIAALSCTVPAQLVNGSMPIVFCEHISLVDMLADFLDYRVPVVSSQGQLRREHLHSAISRCLAAMHELGAEGAVKVIGLTDYDRAGTDIFEAHRRWLKSIFGIEATRWAVTHVQIREAGLDITETHQLDGFIAAYGPPRFRRELRDAVGLPPRGGA